MRTTPIRRKYGIRNWQGGGRASARETIGRVAAAAVAKKVLERLFAGFEIVAYVKTIHALVAEVDPATRSASSKSKRISCAALTLSQPSG
jgi:chorismate synthase